MQTFKTQAQEDFCSTSADVAFFGGAAGCGKTWGLLLCPLSLILEKKHIRSSVISWHPPHKPGGLFSSAFELYVNLHGACFSNRAALFELSARSTIMMRDVHNYDCGTDIDMLCIEEATQFTEYDFWECINRNPKALVRATVSSNCVPSPNRINRFWAREFLDWWIGEDGFPIKERSGVIRYFVRLLGEIFWADSAEELAKRLGISQKLVKSATFISASTQDNPYLDEHYIKNINMLPELTKLKLLNGIW